MSIAPHITDTPSARPAGSLGPPEAPAAIGPSVCPKPGTYEDITLQEYLRWDAVSSSFLKAMRRSPAHARYERDHQEWTESLKLGDAIHLLTLQPAGFRERYIEGDQCNAITGNGKGERCSRAGAIFTGDRFLCAQHGKNSVSELEVLTPAQWERVHDTADAILASEPASILLNDDGEIELSIVWDDPHTGLRCKARIDKLCRGAKTITDIKTTQDAEPEKFAHAIYDYGYEIQAAHYLEGCIALKIDDPRNFTIIAAETEPYHGVSVSDLDFEDIALGCLEIKVLMGLIAKCKAEDHWPSYALKNKISMTDWQRKRIKERLQI